MEDFVTLVKRGVIYDGCPIVAKGTVRINGNDISIESMHNLMAVDGKNFADMCESGSRTEQGQYLEKDLEALESWKVKAEKLAQEKDLLASGLNKTISALQQKIAQEYEKRATIEEHLELERRISEETTLALGQVKSTLSSKSDQVEKLQSALEQKDSELDELKDQLDRTEEMLLEREQKLETLEQDRIERENSLILKRNQAETLQSKLDSASIILEEKDEKLQTLQSELGKKSESVKDANITTQELKEHVVLLESERFEDKKSSAVLVDEFNQWRSVSEEELANLKKDLEQSKSTISTLKNELEVADIEGREYNETLANLQKENQLLREQLELSKADDTKSQEPEKLNRKQRTQSLKNLLRSVAKPKDKDATKESKEEKKHRFSLASNPSA